MRIRRIAELFARLPVAMAKAPADSAADVLQMPERIRGGRLVRKWRAGTQQSGAKPKHNPLKDYFDGIEEGPGVWKWLHYFDAYHTHLAKFRERPITMVEIGVFSGGSMPMWRHYFGDQCQIHGVDIEPACKSYENEHTRIHIGDQQDRGFWKRFRDEVGPVDVLIDDGGHTPEQQMVTLEEMLPAIKPGGVFICEDIFGARNGFAQLVGSLAGALNTFTPDGDQKILGVSSTQFQQSIKSISCYPFLVAIELNDRPQMTLRAPKHGTEWQPFYAGRGTLAEIPTESQLVQ